MHIYIPETQARGGEAVQRLQQNILDRIAAIPGVSSVGIVKGTPHLAAAQLFEDFILSKNTQQVIGNTAVRFIAYQGLTAKYTISGVAPNEMIVFFPTAQVSAQARTFGPIFKSWGF